MIRIHSEDERADGKEPAQIVIAGAGIVGLLLALALHKHVGVKAELYEQASGFQDGVGAGMGMYPNGLRVIRDISPLLLYQIQEQGYPYLFRRWEVRRDPGKGSFEYASSHELVTPLL
jgi:2-polyprenyl-6-methoxyphenol hydroxylase-like FAD-dependent oxidoreductase